MLSITLLDRLLRHESELKNQGPSVFAHGTPVVQPQALPDQAHEPDLELCGLRPDVSTGSEFSGAIRDKNEPKNAVLHQNDEQFRLLVEAVQDYAIFMLSPQGNVVSWNRGAERIKGYKVDEIIGKHFSCFYPSKAIARGSPNRNSGRPWIKGARKRRVGEYGRMANTFGQTL